MTDLFDRIRAGTTWLAFELPGRPVCLKNDRRIVTVRGKPRSIRGDRVREWMQAAEKAWALRWAQVSHDPIPRNIELNASIISYCSTVQRLDPGNTYGAPLDALQHAGVLDNDVQVRSTDGSDLTFSSEPRVLVVLGAYQWRSLAHYVTTYVVGRPETPTRVDISHQGGKRPDNTK